jgi:hypothetical protein
LNRGSFSSDFTGAPFLPGFSDMFVFNIELAARKNHPGPSLKEGGEK